MFTTVEYRSRLVVTVIVCGPAIAAFVVAKLITFWPASTDVVMN